MGELNRRIVGTEINTAVISRNDKIYTDRTKTDIIPYTLNIIMGVIYCAVLLANKHHK